MNRLPRRTNQHDRAEQRHRHRRLLRTRRAGKAAANITLAAHSVDPEAAATLSKEELSEEFRPIIMEVLAGQHFH
ncbi:hypothetical protein FKK50_27370, partial [Klebsiella pneumoniae]|nr:hypothetical protein [Klebsiella pneumoniae]